MRAVQDVLVDHDVVLFPRVDALVDQLGGGFVFPPGLLVFQLHHAAGLVLFLPILRDLDFLARLAGAEPFRRGAFAAREKVSLVGQRVFAVEALVLVLRNVGRDEAIVRVLAVIALGRAKEHGELVLDRFQPRFLLARFRFVLRGHPDESAARGDLVLPGGIVDFVGIRLIFDVPDAPLQHVGGLGVASVERGDPDSRLILPAAIHHLRDEGGQAVLGQDGTVRRLALLQRGLAPLRRSAAVEGRGCREPEIVESFLAVDLVRR